MKIVILAGGSGTRLWPLSRKNNPKQVQPFLDNDTLLQKTYARLRKGFSADEIYIATVSDYAVSAAEQLPGLPKRHIATEPCKKDTAAAIGLMATKFYFYNPREIMITVNADHYINDEDAYIKTLRLAARVITDNPERGGLVGVSPAYPEPGYGYIKKGGQFTAFENQGIFHIDTFVEKPKLETAKKYTTQAGYMWNPGYFIWRVDTLLKQYKNYLPDMYRSFVAINRSLGTAGEQKIIESEYNNIKPISFDYGILEKARNLVIIPADFSFVDIGNWRAVKDVLSKNKSDNITKGKPVILDSAGNLIYNFTKRALAVAGLRDMIVVMTEESTLICHQESAQGVKEIVQKLKDRGLEKYL